MVDLNAFWERISKRPDFAQAGMVLFHVGVVRAFSRLDKKRVERVRIKADHKRLAQILTEARRKPGIVAVEVEIFEGERKVGEPLMILAVAGDFRERVIKTLAETLDRIKAEVTQKEELGAEE